MISVRQRMKTNSRLQPGKLGLVVLAIDKGWASAQPSPIVTANINNRLARDFDKKYDRRGQDYYEGLKLVMGTMISAGHNLYDIDQLSPPIILIAYLSINL